MNTEPAHGSKDKENPCAICGWAQHMAIHRPVIDGPRKGEPLDHAYVPESVMRNPMDKPDPSASVFARAAWFLADYAELWFDTGPHEGDAELRENFARCMEKIELARRLRELDGEWEAKQEAGTTASAAAIVADMLKDWRLPGAVWWHQKRRRWRVTGENYRPGEGEVCVGVYAPGVPAELLAEDFAAVEDRPLVALVGEIGP